MTLKEQLLEAIDVLPSSKLVEALVLIQSLEVPRLFLLQSLFLSISKRSEFGRVQT